MIFRLADLQEKERRTMFESPACDPDQPAGGESVTPDLTKELAVLWKTKADLPASPTDAGSLLSREAGSPVVSSAWLRQDLLPCSALGPTLSAFTQ